VTFGEVKIWVQFLEVVVTVLLVQWGGDGQSR